MDFKMNAWTIIFKGGPIMWPIIFCSVVSLAIVIEKLWYLKAIKIDTEDFLNKILERIKRHQIKEALDTCDKAGAPISRILKAGILKYERSAEQIKEAMEAGSLYEIPRLEKNIVMLSTISYVAILLGLLGTTVGLVRYFQVLQLEQVPFAALAPKELLRGIQEALYTTLSGLIVAIFSFVFYNYLWNRINNYILEIERVSTEFINFLKE